MKKVPLIISAAFTVGAVISCMCNPPAVQAKTVIDNGDFRYKISAEDKTAEIISFRGQSIFLTIPADVDGYTVTAVGAAAFRNNSTIKGLEFPNTVNKIDDCAFQGCTSLEKVQLPANIKEVGDSAFSGCESLRELSADDGLQSIGKYSFSGCTSLQNIHLPNSLDIIGDYAFVNCTSLAAPAIPKSLRYFGGYALENTAWMNSQKDELITVGDGILVKYTGTSAVKTLSTNIKTIGSHAFAGNDTIEEIIIPSTVSVIDVSAFEDCDSLKKLTIPNSVEKIGEKAFKKCTSLKTIDLPNSLNTLSEYLFEGSGLENIKIPVTITNISEGCFSGCEKLKTIDFGNSLKTIKSDSFKDCIELRRVVFPTTLGEIEPDAFNGCNSLVRSEFNGGVKLDALSFNGCPNFEEAVFYKNPSELEDNAFNMTPKLIIYCDNNLYLEEYGASNGRKVETIKNLPVYDENKKLASPDEEESSEFSVGYTFITILIILIDLGLVILTSFYILFIDPKQRKRKHDRVVAQQAKIRRENAVNSAFGKGAQKHSNTVVKKNVSQQQARNDKQTDTKKEEQRPKFARKNPEQLQKKIPQNDPTVCPPKSRRPNQNRRPPDNKK